ncbi:MAG: adenylate/guanylate cyclase domain-containing protein [Spirochaetota bacterium]
MQKVGKQPHHSPRLRSGARFLVGLLVVLVLVSGLASCAQTRTIVTGAALEGINWNPRDGVLIPLGSWERYEGLLRLDELSRNAATLVTLRSRADILMSKDDRSMDRSYRLRVTIAEPAMERALTLVLPTSAPGISVFVNGKMHQVISGQTSFTSADSSLDILVWVPAGSEGIDANRLSPDFVALGESGSMSRFLVLSSLMALSIVAAFALTGIFLLFLYNLWRKNHEFLAFAILLVAEAFRYLVNSRALLPFDIAFIDEEFLHSLSFILQILPLTWFFSIVLSEKRQFKTRYPAIPIVLFVIAEFAMPERLYLIHWVVLLYYILICFASFVGLTILAFRGTRRARWLAPTPLFLLAAIPLRILLPNQPVTGFYLEPLCTVLFAVTATVGLLRKIKYSFQTSEALSDYVLNVHKTVARFIPKEFLTALEKKDVVDLRLGDHVKKDMTIFFSDIRAFTELSEKLTVEENFAFINSYLSRVVPLITESGGFIDKYIGDAIMALYPAEDGADKAIRAAIDIQGKIIEYNGHRAKVGYRPISMGVGIHQGSLMLGVVGVEGRMENTVISDAVNLASRLQAITKAFNVPLAISEQVFMSLKDPGAYTFRFIGKVKVKGKADPVSVFEIFDGIEASLFERKIKANTFFEQGMLAYYQRDFAGAMYYFKRVRDIVPEDGAASFYMETCMNRAIP